MFFPCIFFVSLLPSFLVSTCFPFLSSLRFLSFCQTPVSISITNLGGFVSNSAFLKVVLSYLLLISSSPASGSALLPSRVNIFGFSPPYSVEQYIAQEGSRPDARRFVSLPDHPGCLSVSHNRHPRDTAAGACPKPWKHGGGRGAFEFRTASAEMDMPFVQLSEEVSYQRRLAALLATWWRDDVVLTIPEVGFCCPDEEWHLLWLVLRRRF